MLRARLLTKRQRNTPSDEGPKRKTQRPASHFDFRTEMDKIRERMAQTGITNTSAFIRKMAIDDM